MKVFLKGIHVVLKVLLLTYVFVINILLLAFFYVILLMLINWIFPSFLPDLISRYPLAKNLINNLPFYLLFLYTIYSLSPLRVWILRIEEGFRPLYKEEMERINRLLSELQMNRKVKVYINNDTNINAGAFGFNTIGINKGLWLTASDEELKGVISHEIGHLSHYDFVYSTLLYSLEKFGRRALYGIFFIPAFILSFFGAILVGLAAWTAGFIKLISALWWSIHRLFHYIIYGISRFANVNINKYGEYRCDAYAIKYNCGYGLLSFLRKLSIIEQHKDRLTFTEYVMSTHPSVHKRIARLENMLEKA